MARSQYVYLITTETGEGHEIVAAFTVKHEAMATLETVRRACQNPSVRYDIYRLRDNGEPFANMERML